MKRPHRFQIEIEQSFLHSITYAVVDGNLVVRHSGQEQLKSTPTLMQWTGFWRLCDLIQLWDWKQVYDYDGAIMRDGGHWSLHIAYDKSRSIESSGSNAYPSLRTPLESRMTWDRFGLLLMFIDNTLMNQRFDPRDCYADHTDSPGNV